MKIKYKVFNSVVMITRGMKFDTELPESVVRCNGDGSCEVIGKFHSPVYAQQFAQLMNKQVSDD